MKQFSNLPVVVRQQVEYYAPHFPVLARKQWPKVAILGIVVFLFAVTDFNFQFSIGSNGGLGGEPDFEQISAGLLSPSDENYVPEEKEQESKASLQLVLSDKKEATPVKKTSPKFSDLANEATAVSNALTEEEKREALKLSNLSIVLNPGYFKKHQISQAVAREKLNICINYLKTFAPIAVQQRKEFNIPASITLAQGLLESNAGDSRLAQKANNHFGIKCFSKTCRKGHCMNATDDSHKDFFRVFKTAEESFKERSSFLNKSRYKKLQKLSTKDYKGWANGLQNSGYATDQGYANKLIRIIEALQLYKYD
jgi:flagellum-specific peptidoglycan hydrolase FlgJ